MALKKRVKDINDVAKEFRGEYEKDGDGWVLSVEGDDEPDPDDKGEDDAKARLREFRNENVRLRRESEALRKKLEGFDEEAYASALKYAEQAKSDEERALLKAGKLDEVVKRRNDALRADFEKQQLKLQEELQFASAENEQMRKALHGDRVRSMLRETADRMKLQLLPTATRDFYSRALSVFNGMDDKGVPVALDDDDNIRQTRDGKGDFTPEAFISELLEDAPHLFVAAQTGDSKGGKNGVRQPRGGVVEVDARDPRAFGQNLESIASGKVTARITGE